MFFFSFFSCGRSLEVKGEREEKEEREREREREIVKKEYLNKLEKNRVWNVRCVIKWYGINDEVIFDMVK